MSAVMTGPRPAGPVGVGLAPGSSARPTARERELPDQRPEVPNPQRPDPVVDDPDTEELDLAALLVFRSRAPEDAGSTSSGGVLAPVAPSSVRLDPARRSPRELDRRVDELAPGRSALGPLGAQGGQSTAAEVGRLGLHLLLAALPLLAISAQVFGLVNMNISAGLLVLPLTAVMVAVSLLRPLSSDRIVVAGMAWGLLATVVYDGFRLDTVYLMGWWGDFIPKMGTWLINTDPSNLAEGAIAGYLWRYLGDGGGIGVVFFVAAAAVGLRRLGPRVTVAAAVGFAVFPVWAGLIATVALSTRGQSMMFPLTPTTIGLSLIGHLIFGLVLGLGAVRCELIDTAWPWPPLLELRARRPSYGAAVAWAPITATTARPAAPRPATSHQRSSPPATAAAHGGQPGGWAGEWAAVGALVPPAAHRVAADPTSAAPSPGPDRVRSGRGAQLARGVDPSGARLALLPATRHHRVHRHSHSHCGDGRRRRSMSPFARHHRLTRRRRARRRPGPSPRLALTMLAAVLLVASGLIGAPGVLDAAAAHGPVALVDDTTRATTTPATTTPGQATPATTRTAARATRTARAATSRPATMRPAERRQQQDRCR